MKTKFYGLLAAVILLAACNKKTEDVIVHDATDFKAAITKNGIWLSWTPAPGQDIKEYSLSYLPDGVPRSVSRDSTTVLITNLVTSESYLFSLKVRDAAGHLSPGALVRLTMGSTDTTHIPVTDTGRAVYTGDLLFSSQADINRFNKGYTRIDGKVTISGPDIYSLLPLASIDSVKGLEIYGNDSLSTFAGLEKLKYINGTLYIKGNKKIQHINALGALKTLEKDLVILDNKRLENIDGLSKLQTVNGSLYIGVEAWKSPPKASGNPALANFCGLKLLLSANGLKGTPFIESNLSNPSVNDIITNCN